MGHVLKVTHVFKDETFAEIVTAEGADYVLAPIVIVKLASEKISVEMKLSEEEAREFSEGQQYEFALR